MPRQAVTGPVATAEAALAATRLQQTSIAADVYFAQNGTLDGLTAETLHEFDPTVDASVVLGWTTPADACFQTGQGAATMHIFLSTAGPPLPGPC